VAKRQTDRDSAAPYISRATAPFVVPGTGRLADGHVVQWSMDGFHNAQSPLGTNFLDGDSAPANADFPRIRTKPLWTEQLGITVSDPVKSRRAAAEPAQTSSARAMWQWGTVCPATSPTVHSEPAARAQTHRRADRRHSPSVIIHRPTLPSLRDWSTTHLSGHS
jgi:hypothetical protein